MDNNFDPGGRHDRPDPRDYHYPTEIGSAGVPFDWSTEYDVEKVVGAAIGDTSFKIKPKNQNGSSSCGGQAWSYYGAVLEAIATKSYEERSAKFIYSQTFIPVYGGSSGRDNCILVKKSGWGLESLTTSYDNGNPPSEVFMERPQDITDAARAEAGKARALPYATTGTNLDDVAQAIRDNNGVVLGIDGSNNGTWLSDTPRPPKMGDKLWHHWVYAGKVAMRNGKKAIGILNSWGSVGDNGWQWLDEDYFNTKTDNDYAGNQAVWSGWTLVFNTNEPPATLHHTFNTNMAFGETSDEVKVLQTALTITGDFPSSIKPTGYYGNATAGAVLKFQKKVGIVATDKNHVGPKTRAALNKIFA